VVGRSSCRSMYFNERHTQPSARPYSPPWRMCETSADTALLVGSPSILWVPQSRCTSCDLLILVDEPAEAVVSFDLVGLGWCAAGEWP
jgi:hypothetical protein